MRLRNGCASGALRGVNKGCVRLGSGVDKRADGRGFTPAWLGSVAQPTDEPRRRFAYRYLVFNWPNDSVRAGVGAPTTLPRRAHVLP